MNMLSNQISNDPNFQLKEEKRTVVVQPEKIIDGTRFDFKMSQEAVFFIDSDNNIVSDIKVVLLNLNNYATVKSIMPDAQESVRELKPGDRIIRIGNNKIRDARSMRSAVRTYNLGQTFDVTYRRGETNKDLHLSAQGGAPLGIEIDE